MSAKLIRAGALAIEHTLLRKPCAPMQVTKLPPRLEQAVKKASRIHRARERVLRWAKRWTEFASSRNSSQLWKAVKALERMEKQ